MKRLSFLVALGVLYSTHAFGMEMQIVARENAVCSTSLVNHQYSYPEFANIANDLKEQKITAMNAVFDLLKLDIKKRDSLQSTINALQNKMLEGLSKPKKQTLLFEETPITAKYKTILQECGIHPTKFEVFETNSHIYSAHFPKTLSVLTDVMSLDEFTYNFRFTIPQQLQDNQISVYALRAAMFMKNTAVIKAVTGVFPDPANTNLHVLKDLKNTLRDVLDMQSWVIPALCNPAWNSQLLSYIKGQRNQFNGTESIGTEYIEVDGWSQRINETPVPDLDAWKKWYDELKQIDKIYQSHQVNSENQ